MNKINKTIRRVNLHGDITLYPCDKTHPEQCGIAQQHTLQESPVTGNRHEVVAPAGVTIARWVEDGREYLWCPVDYEIRHVGGDAEHGVQPVQAGTVEVIREKEHDPYTNELRVVVD
jgi:hypothetical protein